MRLANRLFAKLKKKILGTVDYQLSRTLHVLIGGNTSHIFLLNIELDIALTLFPKFPWCKKFFCQHYKNCTSMLGGRSKGDY